MTDNTKSANSSLHELQQHVAYLFLQRERILGKIEQLKKELSETTNGKDYDEYIQDLEKEQATISTCLSDIIKQVEGILNETK